MSHPHGDSQEPVYPPAAAPVPVQPAAPIAETHQVPGAFAPIAPAAPVAPVAETHQIPAPAAPVAPSHSYAAPAPVAATPVAVAPAAEATAAYPVAPVSGPAYAPVSAVPGYPVSAVPGYPVSAVPGYPVSATPYGYAPVLEAPKKKGRAGIIVLSILTGLLVLASAGMSTLYFVEKTERTAADKKVSEQAAAITANEKKIKELESSVATTKSEVAKLTQDLTGAKSKTENLAKEKEALAACFRAMDEYFAAQNNTTRAALVDTCNEAEKYY